MTNTFVKDAGGVGLVPPFPQFLVVRWVQNLGSLGIQGVDVQ